jgi:hypothetical protein
VKPALNVTAPSVPMPNANPINSFFMDAYLPPRLYRAREYKQTDEPSVSFTR